MFTPQKRSGAFTFNSASKKVPLNGLFKDGIWHCNCSPRLPASHFLVKKEGPNKGRGFYTCQEPKENSCGFFLWDDKAVGREMRAVINNTRSEPDPSEAPADASADKGASNKSQDLSKEAGDEEGDEFGDWPLTKEDEEKVAQVAGCNIPVPYPETPRKAVKTDHFSTPGSKRKREEDYLPTPLTGSKGDIFGAPSTAKLNGGMWDGNESVGLRSPAPTPTPSRSTDLGLHEARGESNPHGYDITEEVMELLKDKQIDEDTISNLRQLLNRHALRISGIAKGRDITRISLKAKDAKIAELKQKISSLEAEREMDKTVIRHFKSDMAQSMGSRGGRGRGRGRT